MPNKTSPPTDDPPAPADDAPRVPVLAWRRVSGDAYAMNADIDGADSWVEVAINRYWCGPGEDDYCWQWSAQLHGGDEGLATTGEAAQAAATNRALELIDALTEARAPLFATGGTDAE